MSAISPRIDTGLPVPVVFTFDAALDPPLRGIRIGGSGGDVSVVNHRGSTVPFTSCQPGEVIMGTFQKVNSVGTTVLIADLVGYE